MAVTKQNARTENSSGPWDLVNDFEKVCCRGRSTLVENFLKNGANVNQVNPVYNRAPIHFAAEAGRLFVLEVLLQDERCNPDLLTPDSGWEKTSVPRPKQTALHIAVEKDFTDCVTMLLKYEVNPNIANSEGLTPIHIAARKLNRKLVELILKSSKIEPNLDDFHDCQDGVELTTRQILERDFPGLEIPTAGKKIDTKEFHMYAFEDNEKEFLEKLEKVPNYQLTNISDLMAIASCCNYLHVVRELLKKGQRKYCLLSIADICNKVVEDGHHMVLYEMLTYDAKLGQKLLHLACRSLEKPYNDPYDRIVCLDLILSQPNINVQCEDDEGNIPLHYAARAHSIEGVRRLLKLGNSLGHKNVHGVPPLANMSCEAWSNIFDDSISTVEGTMDKSEIVFNYQYLLPYQELSQRCGELAKKDIFTSTFPEMEAVAYIAENRELQPLLKHPVVSSFLCLKLHRIWYILHINFVLYFIFYVLINLYIVSTNHKTDSSSSSPPSPSNLASTILNTNSQQPDDLGALTAIFLLLLALLEGFQLTYSPGYYLSSLENILKPVLIVLGAWTLIAPIPQLSVILILLTAWKLVIFISQYPRMSTGIEMFKIVAKNFLLFVLPYVIFIFGFALAFFTLFSNTENNENFLNVGDALFKTIVMLTGEFDASDIPFSSHPVFGPCIFVLFVFVIFTVMCNLLNDLALGDTTGISNEAERVALISRVKLICFFEGMAMDTKLANFAGKWFPKTVLRQSLFIAPGFLAMKTHLFPEYLPGRKIGVRQYCSKKIIVYEANGERRFTDWSMDRLIVNRAKEVLSSRKSEREIKKENESNKAQYAKIIHKLDRLIEIVSRDDQ